MIQKRIKKYFDYMALLIRSVIQCKRLNLKDFRSALSDINSKQMINIYQIFPELCDQNRKPKKMEFLCIQSDFFERLENVYNDKDIIYKELLIFYMDAAISNFFKGYFTFEDDIIKIGTLNSNYKQTKIGIVIKVSCGWEHNIIQNNLLGILNNFYYVDYNNMDGFKMINYVIDPVFYSLKEKSSIKIAISPITKEKVVQFSNSYQKQNQFSKLYQNYFRVEKILYEDIVKSIIIENIKEAGEEKVDLMVFPEMLGTKAMLNDTIDYIQNNNLKVPRLIVFPSIWKKTRNDESNTNSSAMILDGKEVLFEQKKYGEFNYTENNQLVYEDINYIKEEDNIINILHVEGIGRICVIICYDYLEEEYRNKVINNVHPTLVCCPSFSTGSYNFYILSEKYFSQNCNFVWCNTCSASNVNYKPENFDIIGLVTMLSKKVDKYKTKEFCNGIASCNKKNCDKCLYYVNIPLKSK